MLLIPRGDLDAELCPNEKVVDASRLFLMRGCAGTDKSLKSHPVAWAHLDHFHRDPVIMNHSDFRKPDVYKGPLTFQP
jgi:hypothetical protein